MNLREGHAIAALFSSPPQGHFLFSFPPSYSCSKMDQIPFPSLSSPTAVLPQASSPTQRTRRLPRTRMGSHASLESIVEEPVSDSLEIPPTQVTSDPTPKSTREHERATATQPQGWNGKKGITTSRAMRDVCGICFESAVKPNKSRCCGQLFCFQHLSDWLSATGSDGRCPTCRVPLTLETDTISLHPPVKAKPAAVRFSLAPLPLKRRSSTNPWSRRFIHAPRHDSSGSSSSSSQEHSDEGSSSTSESEDGASPRRSRAPYIQPKYESMSEMMSDLVPLREFGSLLSLVGCALVIGTLLS